MRYSYLTKSDLSVSFVTWCPKQFLSDIYLSLYHIQYIFGIVIFYHLSRYGKWEGACAVIIIIIIR